jgi:hypothetical protein
MPAKARLAVAQRQPPQASIVEALVAVEKIRIFRGLK